MQMKNFNQYPAQTGDYAVKVKSGAGWQNFDTARLQISVGQPYHEQAKLEATINWVKHRFDRVIICANDTLQRFNFEFDGLSCDEAYKVSENEGREWLERNIALLRTLPSVEIYRWDHWRQQAQFQQSHERTLELYENNIEFKEAIDQNVMDFWNRRKDDSLSSSYQFQRFFNLSRDYLLEETAVFSMMFQKDMAMDIYPGTVLLPCTIFQGRKIEGAPEGLDLGAFTRIDFKRNISKAPNIELERHFA